MRELILLFVKHPEPGKVKTRLAATVGAELAAEIYRGLAEHVARSLPREAAVRILFDPPDKRAEIETWLKPHATKAGFAPQAAGDLGERLTAAFDAAFAAGHRKVAAVGSDCVEISAKTFDLCWRALDKHDLVIGPTADGGYYLIAMTEPRAYLFEHIQWSAETTLAQTLNRARQHGDSIHLLEELHDVDSAADWRIARRMLEMTKPDGMTRDG